MLSRLQLVCRYDAARRLGAAGTSRVTAEDAHRLFAEMYLAGEVFDIVDVDQFGSENLVDGRGLSLAYNRPHVCKPHLSCSIPLLPLTRPNVNTV